jgi:hypothetical protein
MDFHLFEIPLREAGNSRGEPRLVLYLVGRGPKRQYLPIGDFCGQLNHVLEAHGLGQVKVSTSDIIFALRSKGARSLEHRRPPRN